MSNQRVRLCFNCGEPADYQEPDTGLWTCGAAACERELTAQVRLLWAQAEQDARDDDYSLYRRLR